MKWNEKLRELRGEKTIEEVVDATGINPNVYMAYESRERMPLDPVKKIIADYFSVKISDIWS